jgi:hypothetical protein
VERQRHGSRWRAFLGKFTGGCPLWGGVASFDSFPIILRHLEKTLTLKIEGSDGCVLSASAFEPAEFL